MYCINGIYSKQIFIQENNYVSLLQYSSLDTFLHNPPSKEQKFLNHYNFCDQIDVHVSKENYDFEIKIYQL